MIRLVLLVGVVLLVVWLFTGLRRRQGPGDAGDKTSGGDTAAKGAQQMVQCAHCGVHLPRGDAVADGTLSYCGEAHRVAGPHQQ